MSYQHQKQIISNQSPLLGQKDMASQHQFKLNDEVLVCSKNKGAFLEKSLPEYEGKCPFCQQIISSQFQPKDTTSSKQQKNHEKKAVPPPQYPSPSSRNTGGGVAAIGIGGILLVSFLCVASILFFALINNPPGGPTPPPTRKPASTATPARITNPTPRNSSNNNSNNSNNSNNQPSNQQQSKTYAEVSCADIYVANLRRTPGYVGKNDETDSLAEVSCGEIVELLGESSNVDGLTWWKVRWNGYTGWIADHTGSGKIILDFTP